MHADPKSIIFISAGFTVLHMKHKYIKYHNKIAAAYTENLRKGFIPMN